MLISVKALHIQMQNNRTGGVQRNMVPEAGIQNSVPPYCY